MSAESGRRRSREEVAGRAQKAKGPDMGASHLLRPLLESFHRPVRSASRGLAVGCSTRPERRRLGRCPAQTFSRVEREVDLGFQRRRETLSGSGLHSDKKTSTRSVQLERSERAFACLGVANRAAKSTRYPNSYGLITQRSLVQIQPPQPTES
jgi:hypothetical protein